MCEDDARSCVLLTRKGSIPGFKLIMSINVTVVQVFVCRSGSAADTQAITAYVQYYLHQHQMELNDEILVKTAASFATRMVYSNKASLTAGHRACRLRPCNPDSQHPRILGREALDHQCPCRKCCKQALLWRGMTPGEGARCLGFHWGAHS